MGKREGVLTLEILKVVVCGFPEEPPLWVGVRGGTVYVGLQKPVLSGEGGTVVRLALRDDASLSRIIAELYRE